ncbi:hypothetical protein FRACYDRAFT_259227 [Fragilariopsis cylindrus CCMP1102]|uniref:Uncharacterized protein n=1 Tax=Fragilariopsis cylindrus CCMP1102 TaxID=635003 RepID=A0A1E7FXG0_9STRA|nr:hypothetical protein FRACYDRAFT_259227 [Fragilariopsis cylindrus CCMP1102]|eukprot:OEU22841.1 hypothetical protein FRACYDRAFT_259227 [Fragilariopsis cylindrus CCMP1102]
MNDSKTTSTSDDDDDVVPLVQALLVSIDAEHVVDAIRTEYGVIDEYNLDDSEFSSESNNSIFCCTTTELWVEEDIPVTAEPNWSQDNQQQQQQQQQRQDVDQQSRTIGAWASFSVLGFLIGGPSLSMIFGIGAAFCSQQEEGVFAGDVARAIGDVAIFSRQKCIHIDQKYSIVDKIANRAFTLSRNCVDIVAKSINYVLPDKDDICRLRQRRNESKRT